MKKALFIAVASLLIVVAHQEKLQAFNLGVPNEVTNAIVDTYSEKTKEVKELKFSLVKKAIEEKDQLKTFYIRPTVALPAFKIYRSGKENTMLDVSVNSGIGGGVSAVWYKDATDPTKMKTVVKKDGTKEEVIDTKTEARFSFSPLTILMSKSAEEGNINLSWAATVGFFNNTILLGVGYDFGEVKDRDRFFGLISIGTSF